MIQEIFKKYHRTGVDLEKITNLYTQYESIYINSSEIKNPELARQYAFKIVDNYLQKMRS